MTLGAVLGVVLGLCLGLLGPRAGRWLLAAVSVLLVTLLLAARAGASGWTFLGTVLGWVLLLAAAAALVVRRPRAGLLLGLLLALLLGVGPLLVGTGTRPSGFSLAVGAAFLVLAVRGFLRPAFGLRLSCAALGARLVLWAVPGETVPWHWPVLALALLWASRLAAARPVLGRGPRREAARAAGAAAGLGALAAAAAAVFTPELPPPTPGSRLERLARLAPRGGYLWPEPSETLVWEDAAGFRGWDNLGLHYLTGTLDRGVRRPAGSSALLGRFSLNRDVAGMRRVKDPSELAHLAAAARAIVAAVRQTAPGRAAGVTERAIAESVRSQARAAGCSEDSFPPVVAAGARAASIHASPTDAPLLAGQMVVVDVGCSVHHYASDFTRTFPVGGRFSPEQRRYYEAVYAAQQAALAACRPGALLAGKTPDGSPSLDDIAHRVLLERLGERGYSHGLGHGVGLFVHDGYGRGPLAEGMVITLEPGLYLPGRLGIRIEDTYRVTASGCEPLTVGLPADPDSVESFLAGAP